MHHRVYVEDRVCAAHAPMIVTRNCGTTTHDAREIDDGIVIDLDADGHAVGIDIDQASKRPPGRRGNVIRVRRPLGSIWIDWRLASWP